MMPALGFFESGLLRSKNSVSILSQIFFGMALFIVLFHWIGFTLIFGEDLGGIIGNLDFFALLNLEGKCLEGAETVPAIVYAIFQMMFATITPLLMTGSFAERIKFFPIFIFLFFWEIFVYYPVAHWIWGGGWLSKFKVLDFAGGIVIHTTSGSSALLLSYFVGKRIKFEKYKGEFPPSNLAIAAIGGAFLFSGW